MKYTNLNAWNNSATASTDCVSEYLFCAQYFKNRRQNISLSKFSKFQNNSRTRLKKWPFSRIIQVQKKFQNNSRNSRNSRTGGHPQKQPTNDNKTPQMQQTENRKQFNEQQNQGNSIFHTKVHLINTIND